MYQQSRTLVLRVQVAAEADKLVTLYTHEWGKISAVVPGAKKVRARLSAATEPVTESELIVYQSGSAARPKVTGARLIDNFPELRKDWRRFAMAQYCAEITEVLTPFNAENAKKYDLLLRTWQLLGRAAHPWRIFLAFTLRFLKLSGYSFIDYVRHEAPHIPGEEKEALRRLATLSGEEIDTRLSLAPELEKDIVRRLEGYLRLYLPRPLAAQEFWQKIFDADRECCKK